jgi:serine/threonine-protein kinase PknK
MAGTLRDAPRAARLWGAADALSEATGSPWMSFEKGLHEPYLAAARSGIDEADWRAAWEEGRAMTLEDAIACALGSRRSGVAQRHATPATLSPPSTCRTSPVM